MPTSTSLTMAIYEGFAHGRLAHWDAVFHSDVQINSPAGRDIAGLDALKAWVQALLAAFRPRVDLSDHYVAGERALLTINLHWRHDGAPFFDIAPTGKGGTSVETFVLRLKDGQVTHFDVADNSLDLALYLHQQGMALPSRVTPPALVSGQRTP